jgi:hypothetical protein
MSMRWWQWYLMMSLVLGICGTGYLFIALRGLITRRPFLISDRVAKLFSAFVWLIFACTTIPDWEISHWWVIVLLLSGLTVVLLRVRSMKRGYAVYGVTSESLEQGLLNSLTNLNLPYEKTFGGWRLSAIGDDLELTVSLWGIWSMTMKQRQSDSVLRDITREMSEYYRKGPLVELNTNLFIRHLDLGGVLALVTFGLTFGKVL